jgi:outer membrane protein assembly factor BamA
MSPQTSLGLSATYGVLRFLGNGSAIDSDTYGFQSTFGYAFTPRLTGTLAYNFTHLDLKGQEDSNTHNPSVGFIYRLTPTLTAAVSGGPAFTQISGRTTITPAGAASLTQVFRWGSAGVEYSRGVSAAGGFGGTTDTQTVSGTLSVQAVRGLFLAFTPGYSTSESVSRDQTGQVDVQTFTVGLSAFYQITRYVGMFAGYTFLHERTSGSSSLQVDVDQNRVRVGLQFGYPINFD